jgi:hypothetical protein
LLTGPTLPGDALWVVDLRVEIPFEKSWLVGRNPIEAFASEAEYLTLAQRLASRRGRAALSNGLVRLHAALDEWWERADSDVAPHAKDPVADVRLVIANGTQLNPIDVYHLVVSDRNDLSDEGKEAWNGLWDELRGLVAADGCNLLATEFSTLDFLPARRMRSSIPLELSGM